MSEIVSGTNTRWAEEAMKFWNDLGISIKLPSLSMPPAGIRKLRLIVVPGELSTMSENGPIAVLFEMLRRHYPVRSKIAESEMRFHERHPRDGTYAVYAEGIGEPSEKYAGMNAHDLCQQGIKTMTIFEGLIFDLMHFRLTGEHANRKNYTYCTGSSDKNPERNDRVSSPVIDWPEKIDVHRGGELFVNMYPNAGHVKHYRPRQVWPAS